ncbi:hypothetical protein FJTKL_15372 [Diaporthe vaccinii]|uniref:Uncharacterized protein n=1 Tax=Diaporthe vaccinii TaxID=105482 RepID=A0ABR4E549_9PEZI
MTQLDELRFWDNPDLARAVSDGRIAKPTSRERYLEPMQQLMAWQAAWRRKRGALVWTMLKTKTAKPSTAVVNWMPLPSLGRVSLAQFDSDKLAWIIHPQFHSRLKDAGEKAHVFAETVVFPLYNVWALRREVYTSAARFEKSMTTKEMVCSGHRTLGDRWPLKLPLDIAMGYERDKYVITLPFPAELFALAWEETVGNSSFEKRMRLYGFDAIVAGEFTLVFLHELDLNLVHYGLVTRGADGQLEVRDPAAAAREAGDEEAALAWERGFPAVNRSEGQDERAQKRYVLLDVAAVEKIHAASTTVARKRNRIEHFLRRFLEDCKTAMAALVAEHERCIAEQHIKTEAGCKRPKSEDLDDWKAEPEAKWVKTEPP